MTVGGISIFSKITTKGMSLWIKKEGKRGKFLTLKCYSNEQRALNANH